MKAKKPFRIEDKFLVMPILLLHNKDLTMTEKLIFIEITQLFNLEYGCIARNKHFMELLRISKPVVSRAINNLKRKGYISVKIFKGTRNHRREITVLKPLLERSQNVYPPLTKSEQTKVIDYGLNISKEKDLNTDIFWENKNGVGFFPSLILLFKDIYYQKFNKHYPEIKAKKLDRYLERFEEHSESYEEFSEVWSDVNDIEKWIEMFDQFFNTYYKTSNCSLDLFLTDKVFEVLLLRIGLDNGYNK